MTFFIYLVILFSCASCIALNEIWKLGEKIRYRRWLLPFLVTVMFCLPGTTDAVHYRSNYPLFCCKMNCFLNSSTEHYQYTSKAAVIKLSFWVRWHVMLLMCCRLQELEMTFCDNMTDRGLLEGIGSLQELTSFSLIDGDKLTAQALSTFLHRPSMTSIVSLNLSFCSNLDDEGLKGIAKRCNKLTYLHV